MTGCWRSARRWPTSIAAGAGAIASGPGTRPPTPACSTRPRSDGEREGLVWIGNWGDGERTRGDRGFPARARRERRPAARHLWRALSRRGAGDARAPWRALSWLGAQRARAGDLRAPPRHRACAAPLLCDDPARHPDHPRVRGARLRHPARLRAMGRCRASVPPRHRLSRRARRRGDDAALRASARRPGLRAALAAERAGDHPRPPHLRAPRRRTARHRRHARRAPRPRNVA